MGLRRLDRSCRRDRHAVEELRKDFYGLRARKRVACVEDECRHARDPPLVSATLVRQHALLQSLLGEAALRSIESVPGAQLGEHFRIADIAAFLEVRSEQGLAEGILQTLL